MPWFVSCAYLARSSHDDVCTHRSTSPVHESRITITVNKMQLSRVGQARSVLVFGTMTSVARVRGIAPMFIGPVSCSSAKLLACSCERTISAIVVRVLPSPMSSAMMPPRGSSCGSTRSSPVTLWRTLGGSVACADTQSYSKDSRLHAAVLRDPYPVSHRVICKVNAFSKVHKFQAMELVST